MTNGKGEKRCHVFILVTPAVSTDPGTATTPATTSFSQTEIVHAHYGYTNLNRVSSADVSDQWLSAAYHDAFGYVIQASNSTAQVSAESVTP